MVGTVDQLNLFEPPVIQSAVIRSHIVDIRPTSHLSSGDQAPIHFSLGADSRFYLDIHQSRLHVKARLLHADGSKLAEAKEGDAESSDEDVAPTNLTLQSLWSAVQVKVAGKSTGQSTTGAYPYVALFQNLLRNSSAAKRGPMAAQMYFKETGKNLDTDTRLNMGYNKRKAYFKGSRQVSMEGPLLADFCSIQKYLLCNTSVEISLFRSRPEFLVQTTTDKQYSMKIEDIFFKAHYVEVAAGVIAGHSESLKKNALAIYPFCKTDFKVFNIAQGSTNFSFDNLFNNSYPQRVLCALVRSDAYSGNSKMNSFFLQNFSLNHIELCADGVSVPGRGPNMDFDDMGRGVASAYLSLYDAVGASNSPIFYNDIDMDDFCHSHCIFAFPLQASALGGNFMEIKRTANLSIKGTFSEALKQSVSLLVYSEFPGIAEIDASRNLTIH